MASLRSLATLVAAVAAASHLPAQGNGVVLLAKVKTYGQYNDVWGYTAPDGREYALVGTVSGTAIYNCTVPTAPYETGFIAGPTSIWRDMKTWDHYAYVVTEGGGGVQIVDLADPENPVLLKTWGASLWDNAHNIAMDTGTGHAYVCGTNRGMRVLDVATDPENPSLVATYSSPYVHDLHVQNGQAHLAEIYDGRYRLVSVAGLPAFPTLDAVITPGQFTHNTWANAAGTLCATTDETTWGHVTLWDISTPTNIRRLDEWAAGPNTIVHNVYIRGDRAYCSYYTEGFVCLDISDPTDIRLVGSYDTSPFGPGSGYKGAWGCYPFAPSGVVYVTDMEEGLHVLRVDGIPFAIRHQPLASTEDETGPYPVVATVTPNNPGSTVATATLWYRVEGGSWQAVAMAPTGVPDEWAGSIPGQAAPAVVDYYLVAEDAQGRRGWLPAASAPGADVFSFAVGRLVQLYANDFEGATDEGWTHGMVQNEDDWERGTPQGKGGDASRHQGLPWQDPAAAASGTKCWGNDLGTGTRNGAYGTGVLNWLESPPVDCSASTHTTLIFQRWLTVEAAPYDHARILVNGQVAWENPMGLGGDAFHIVDTAWRPMVLDISALADGQPAVVVRFELESDGRMQLGGWNVDDFRLVSLQDVPRTDEILLTGPASVPVGGTATFQVSGAHPQADWWLLWSLALGGSSLHGHPFDLAPPIRVAFQGTTDGQGAASWTSGPVPPAAAGRTLHFEAASALGGEIRDSNPLDVAVP